jgi:endoglucanase
MLTRARAQKALAVFVAYYVTNRGCSGYREGAPDPAAYRAYIQELVEVLGDRPAVVIMEPDAVAADCFDAARGRLLADATRQLSVAGHAVYLDAGHARWRSTGETALRLRQAGITDAEGFAINVANRQTTEESYRWGRELSNLVGEREFVIDTSRNGAGPPPDDPDRDDEWCNPQRQGLGTPPRTTTGQPAVRARAPINAPYPMDSRAINQIEKTSRLPSNA